MMASEQVKDVLKNTRTVHQRAQALFAHLAQRSEQPRAKLLLDYLSSHEQHLADAIREIEADATYRVLTTWVSSTVPVTHLAEQLDWDEASRQQDTFDDLVALGLSIDNKVVEVYEDLANRAEPAWLKEMFQNLFDMETQEEKLMAKQTLRGMDF